MAWQSSGSNNDEMVDNLKRKYMVCCGGFGVNRERILVAKTNSANSFWREHTGNLPLLDQRRQSLIETQGTRLIVLNSLSGVFESLSR